MPLALILRARTTALVILNTLGMVSTVKVRLLSVMPFIFLELRLDRLLIHSNYILNLSLVCQLRELRVNERCDLPTQYQVS